MTKAKTGRSNGSRKPKRPVWLFLLIAVIVAIGLVLMGVGIHLARTALFSLTAHPPRVGTQFLAPQESKANYALSSGIQMSESERAATEYLAAQPTAYWLTPEQDPIGTAGGTVNSLISQARDQKVGLALVVYGLPERDCGNHSAGGLPTDQYQSWIGEIAAALEIAPDVKKAVILEPDSLALAPECGNIEERSTQLHEAVNTLAGTATWIYLDGGHSGWLPADKMASMISSVGVNDKIRGFATNVSNYRSTYDEFAYAEAVSQHLGGLHAVIDTSRNGAASAGSEWCNPRGQLVGDPSGTFGNEVVDTNIWIKPPGESDGPCNGGPVPGVWWPEGAEELTRAVL